MAKRPARRWFDESMAKGFAEFDRVLEDACSSDPLPFSALGRNDLAALKFSPAEIERLEVQASLSVRLSVTDIPGLMGKKHDAELAEQMRRIAKAARTLHELIDGAPFAWRELFGIEVRNVGDWPNAHFSVDRLPPVLAELLRIAEAADASPQRMRAPKGRRTTNYALFSLVSGLEGVLVHMGVKYSTAERSRMVRAMRVVAGELRIDGDPRDTLRSMGQMRARAAADAQIDALT